MPVSDDEVDDKESELEMNERQCRVLERGGDIMVSEDTEELVADALDETEE